MCREVGDYYYLFPTFAQGRKVIWDATMNDGRRMIDFFPKELILGKPNQQEMKIRFKNGSLFQIVGSDNIDKIMGTNPKGAVFSEFAMHTPLVWSLMRPIFRANKGWALFITTPRGKNHFYDLWDRQKDNPEWFCQKLSVDKTGVLTDEDIQKERDEGMSEDMIQQEYYCSFDLGIEGSYYAKQMNQLDLDGHFCRVPVDPLLPVHTVWDIGFRDPSSIIFFQRQGRTIHIVDSYECNQEGLPHFVKVLQDKGYTYGEHIAPHDIGQNDWSIGKTRQMAAAQLGLRFLRLPQSSVHGGIEQVRALLPFCYFDLKKTELLRKALSNYRKSYNPVNRIYSSSPVHDWTSHFSDAFRYLAEHCRMKTASGSKTADQFLSRRQELQRPM